LDQWDIMAHQGEGENLHLLRRRIVELARSFASRTPDATHLLLALLHDTNGSARRVLQGLAIDVSALRCVAMQIGQGLPTRTRAEPSKVAPAVDALRRVERAEPKGQAVPVMPVLPVRGPRAGQPAAVTDKSVVARSEGQALPIVPELGPLPSPSERVKTRRELEHRLREAVAPPRSALSDELTAGSVSDEVGQTRYGLNPKKFPILTQVGRNLTASCASGDEDPVVGREEEIEQVLDVLAKRQGNNPCLIGAAGVGKTSVVRGVARALAQTPGEDRLIIEIPIAELLAGTGVRGALAGRLAALKKEVQAAGRVILFFDEIHQLFSGEGAEEVASELKISLARGELPCIGVTSTVEYQRVFEHDPGLSRRFSPIEVEEPGREDAFLILTSLRPRLEKHHGIHYQEEALALSIAWSLRYLPGRCLPDKAVQLLDLAGARARRRGVSRVDARALAEVVAAQSNMPIERLLESDGDRMLRLEEILCERVIGHEVHMRKVARILRRNAAGLGGRRPIGTFLLLGPTGVGKTETAKAIAEVLFHSESAMTRIDMAEMSEAHAVAKLVGAPPGYIGHDAGGQLTDAVRRRPYQVLLLDEIEKAHPEVLTAFLAVFDEGRMTDSRGRLVDFTNTVIVLTSNLGAHRLASASRKRVGFSSLEEAGVDDTSKPLLAAAREALAPELFNRIDEILPFSPLNRGDVFKIGRKLCQGLADEMELSRGIALSISDEAIEVLLEQGGFEPELGARPLRRTIARKVEAPLAEAILAGELKAGDTWLVEASGGELCFDTVSARAAE
jgi:ATP-dependent Clp protease ATP-binding subunit ClpC